MTETASSHHGSLRDEAFVRDLERSGGGAAVLVGGDEGLHQVA